MPAKGVTRNLRAKPANTALIATREICCQTDDLDQALASDVGKLDALKKTFDSVAISSRDPNVLLYQQRTSLRLIEKLSSENRKVKQENEKIVTFMGETFRLVRAMRSEYDSTFVNVQDDFKSMRYDWGRYMTEVAEHFVKQKKSIEDEKKRFKNVMKKKDLHIQDLQSRLNISNEQIKVTVQALEAQQRRVTIAQRDVYAAQEEVKDVNRKLNDQLYLAAHQKCRSCQASEKVREMLSNEIAEKTTVIESMRDKCVEIDGLLQQQKRVNEILSRSVDKHAFSEKAIRGEFDRIKSENDSLMAQIKMLKTVKKVDSTGTNTVAVSTSASQSASITPPDSSSSDKSTKDEPGNESQHGSLQSTPNAGPSNSPANQPPDKTKPSSAVKTALISRSHHASTNCSSPTHIPASNSSESSNMKPQKTDFPAALVPLKKKLKKKPMQQHPNTKLYTRPYMPIGKNTPQMTAAQQEDLEDGELNDRQLPPFKVAQKRMGEGGPNMALAKKKKSLAIKQKLALARKLDAQEIAFRPSNVPPNNIGTNKFAEQREVRFVNDYEWSDRSLLVEEKLKHDARRRDLHSREYLRASMEREPAPVVHNPPWQDKAPVVPFFREKMARGLPDQNFNLCPAPPIAPQLAPPPQMRAFQRCEGATLDDVMKRENMIGARRGQRMSPPTPQRRLELLMENRVPRTSSGLHYARSFEEPQLPDLRSQLGMFTPNSRVPSNSRAPPPPTFMRPPPESPIQRDRMTNNAAVPLQWGNLGGSQGGQPTSGWGGILGPYLQDSPRQQPPQPQKSQNNSWLPNGQNFWRH